MFEKFPDSMDGPVAGRDGGEVEEVAEQGEDVDSLQGRLEMIRALERSHCRPVQDHNRLHALQLVVVARHAVLVAQALRPAVLAVQLLHIHPELRPEHKAFPRHQDDVPGQTDD